MKRIFFATLATITLIFHCYSQDIITKNSGDSIQAKVLEVTQTEIKYKRFDNQTGPTYSLLKSEVLMIRYENGSKDIFGKIEPKQFEGNMGQIYFLRSTGYVGSAITDIVFIDDSLICKLKNDRYSMHFIKPGEHKFSVQGASFTVGAEPITIKIESGRIYYIQLISLVHFTYYDLSCQQITESSAKTILLKLKETKKCQ